jgi:hypothetical protein
MVNASAVPFSKAFILFWPYPLLMPGLRPSRYPASKQRCAPLRHSLDRDRPTLAEGAGVQMTLPPESRNAG